MITVDVQLSRSGAYFVGEMIRCRAIISNRGTETGTLAGVFARLHCTRASNPKWVKKDSLVTFDKEHGAVAAVAKESDSLEMQSTEAFPWRAKGDQATLDGASWCMCSSCVRVWRMCWSRPSHRRVVM